MESEERCTKHFQFIQQTQKCLFNRSVYPIPVLLNSFIREKLCPANFSVCCCCCCCCKPVLLCIFTSSTLSYCCSFFRGASRHHYLVYLSTKLIGLHYQQQDWTFYIFCILVFHLHTSLVLIFSVQCISQFLLVLPFLVPLCYLGGANFLLCLAICVFLL